MPEYLLPEDIDEQLKLPPGTTKRRARRGEIPAVQLPGGHIRIPKNEFERWLSERLTTREGDK